MVDLNTLIAPLSGWKLLDASAINDAGQITGQGLIGGEYHGYLLTPVPPIPGDFNNDGTVDAADYVVWRKNPGGIYTQNDFNIWRTHFGQTADSGAGVGPNATVPEPTTLVMLIVAAVGIRLRPRQIT